MDGRDSGLGSFYHLASSTGPPNGMFPPPAPPSSSSPAEAGPVLFPHSVSSRASAAPPPVPSELVRRKRGRPRKYGVSASPSLSPSVSSFASANASSSSPLPLPSLDSPASARKKEPSLSKKAQLAALGNAGQGFTSHVIRIAVGEDVAQKIMSFMQQRKRAVCILSASGSISNASLRQPAMLGGNVTYEGRFEILSLCGSFLQNETNGSPSRTGGLSICLSNADGHIVGGAVGGPLIAASPVQQVIAGSFLIDSKRETSHAMKMNNSSSKLSSSVQAGAVVLSPVTLRSTSESAGTITMSRGTDDHQSFGGSESSYMMQFRPMHVLTSRSTDWRVSKDEVLCCFMLYKTEVESKYVLPFKSLRIECWLTHQPKVGG